MFRSSVFTNSSTWWNNVMASTSDRLEGIFPRKHADAAATGLMPIASHLTTVLSRELPYVGSYSLHVGGIIVSKGGCMVDVGLTGEKQILSLRMPTQHPFLDNVSRTKDPVNPEPIDLVGALLGNRWRRPGIIRSGGKHTDARKPGKTQSHLNNVQHTCRRQSLHKCLEGWPVVEGAGSLPSQEITHDVVGARLPRWSAGLVTASG